MIIIFVNIFILKSFKDLYSISSLKETIYGLSKKNQNKNLCLYLHLSNEKEQLLYAIIVVLSPFIYPK